MDLPEDVTEVVDRYKDSIEKRVYSFLERRVTAERARKLDNSINRQYSIVKRRLQKIELRQKFNLEVVLEDLQQYNRTQIDEYLRDTPLSRKEVL